MPEQHRPVIVVPAFSEEYAQAYVDALTPWGVEPLVVTPRNGVSIAHALERMEGLLLTGGADVHPSRYGEPSGPHTDPNEDHDEIDFPLLEDALGRDLPVVGICRGLQVLNVACGGSLLQHVPGHHAGAGHRIWIAPGSKLAAIVGAGGQVRVNSRHHQGVTEARRAPTLMSTAFAVDDNSNRNLVEGLESPHHRFVVSVQCHPERADELPKQFQNLFAALVFQAANPKG